MDYAADLKIITTAYEMIAYDRKWFCDQNILNPDFIVYVFLNQMSRMWICFLSLSLFLFSLFLSLSLILAFFCDRFSKRLESWSYYHKVSSAFLSAVVRGLCPSSPENPKCYIYCLVWKGGEVFLTFLVSEAHTSQPPLRNTSQACHQMGDSFGSSILFIHHLLNFPLAILGHVYYHNYFSKM